MCECVKEHVDTIRVSDQRHHPRLSPLPSVSVVHVSTVNHTRGKKTQILVRANCIDFWRLVWESGLPIESHTILYPNPCVPPLSLPFPPPPLSALPPSSVLATQRGCVWCACVAHIRETHAYYYHVCTYIERCIHKHMHISVHTRRCVVCECCAHTQAYFLHTGTHHRA